MATELEAKLKVESHEPIRARLAEIGAEPLGRVLEINHIFDSVPRALFVPRSLLASGRGLRIRECLDESGQLVRASLTFKGPRTPSPLKRREEIETAIDDPDAARTILERLGFAAVVCFQKRRETWRLGDCLIELDELPHLGMFVEIEGPDEAAIDHLRGQLNLSGTPVVAASYIGLLINYCKEHALPAASITF